MAEQAALVSQVPFLFDDTVRGNVTLGADVDDEQVWAALRLAQADGFVAALAGRAGHPGRRARHHAVRRPAAAARAGPGAGPAGPGCWCSTTPPRSVDPAVEAAILRGLRSAELGATVVVVAYRRATIALADEVVYIEHGRVVDRGPHEELLGPHAGLRRLVTAYDDEAERRAGLVAAEEAAR